MKKKILKIIEELEGLKQAANLRAHRIVDDGRIVHPEERMNSQGHVDAYAFCIMRLKEAL